MLQFKINFKKKIIPSTDGKSGVRKRGGLIAKKHPPSGFESLPNPGRDDLEPSDSGRAHPGDRSAQGGSSCITNRPPPAPHTEPGNRRRGRGLKRLHTSQFYLLGPETSRMSQIGDGGGARNQRPLFSASSHAPRTHTEPSPRGSPRVLPPPPRRAPPTPPEPSSARTGRGQAGFEEGTSGPRAHQ